MNQNVQCEKCILCPHIRNIPPAHCKLTHTVSTHEEFFMCHVLLLFYSPSVQSVYPLCVCLLHMVSLDSCMCPRRSPQNTLDLLNTLTHHEIMHAWGCECHLKLTCLTYLKNIADPIHINSDSHDSYLQYSPVQTFDLACLLSFIPTPLFLTLTLLISSTVTLPPALKLVVVSLSQIYTI